MKSKHHEVILASIRKHSGKPTQHTFLNKYLGNEHPRYPISAPVLRQVAKEWMRAHRDMDAKTFSTVISSLVAGESSTEKFIAGMLLSYASPLQRKFDPGLFDRWLDHLTGWAEVDSVCTGDFTSNEILAEWKKWKGLLIRLSKSKNINKRRASLVLLCSPLRHTQDPRLAAIALRNIEKLKHEREVLITKAISWVLRSMVTHHRRTLQDYLKESGATLPRIAVRETTAKLKTGVKSKRKPPSPATSGI